MSTHQNEPAIAETDAQLIDRLTEDAVNAIALLVQTAIGQRDGGIGGVYFLKGDEPHEMVRDVVQGYFNMEMAGVRADVACEGDAERKGGL